MRTHPLILLFLFLPQSAAPTIYELRQFFRFITPAPPALENQDARVLYPSLLDHGDPDERTHYSSGAYCYERGNRDIGNAGMEFKVCKAFSLSYISLTLRIGHLAKITEGKHFTYKKTFFERGIPIALLARPCLRMTSRRFPSFLSPGRPVLPQCQGNCRAAKVIPHRIRCSPFLTI